MITLWQNSEAESWVTQSFSCHVQSSSVKQSLRINSKFSRLGEIGGIKSPWGEELSMRCWESIYQKLPGNFLVVRTKFLPQSVWELRSLNLPSVEKKKNTRKNLPADFQNTFLTSNSIDLAKKFVFLLRWYRKTWRNFLANPILTQQNKV